MDREPHPDQLPADRNISSEHRPEGSAGNPSDTLRRPDDTDRSPGVEDSGEAAGRPGR